MREDGRICDHIPGGMWNTAPIPCEGRVAVRCPCCGGGGACDIDDDLEADPMLCPYCGVGAVKETA